MSGCMGGRRRPGTGVFFSPAIGDGIDAAEVQEHAISGNVETGLLLVVIVLPHVQSQRTDDVNSRAFREQTSDTFGLGFPDADTGPESADLFELAVGKPAKVVTKDGELRHLSTAVGRIDMSGSGGTTEIAGDFDAIGHMRLLSEKGRRHNPMKVAM
ncbi:hypothetical protein LA03_06440 [Burkholderia gladioli]|nr:hypothetical protein LA03_06440 [Burkholderia gladioli]